MVELTRAQQLLAAKSLAVKREKQAATASKQQLDDARRIEISRKRDLALEHKRSHGTKVLAHYVERNLAAFAMREPPRAKLKDAAPGRRQPERSQSSPAPATIDQRREPDVHHRPPRQQPPNAWAKMYALEQVEVQAEEQRRRQVALAKRADLKRALDAQQSSKLHQVAAAKSVEHAHFEQQQRDLAAYELLQQQKQIEKERKQLQDNADVQRMADEARQRKARQRNAEIQAELDDVARTKAALEQDRLRREHEKLLKAKEVERVKLENQRLLDEKRKAVLADQDLDRLVHKRYMERLAEQERQRVEALERTYARQEKRVNMALLNVVSEAEKARIDEERANRVQADVDARKAAMEAAKKARQEESNQRQRDALEKQHADRVLAMKREKESSLQAEKAWIQDTLAAEVHARAKQAAKHAQDKAYREQLAQQMRSEQRKRETTDKWAMDATEMILNADRLRKAGVPVPSTTH
ncbi:hypothetical protein SPRG_08114 [Saprolegnia parasitica CBS 223.65]|uniref:Trichohyalin-plectin-homology domain-containing protein n=1 Tax=Saprolegnia parasitica (strain CBS 223.65) TaxID=695850 RepID=A0A067C7T2_SAPPC|nr:hypothetical protein SPRG_08114 [Saprolegnia parasitica CBS 223.65]KDO26824.1 hypothetical protein SPRG_08114 [Saprolegnia parasitica CBS 223.65]|eukprot:XP_012202472.1 hypothetical protein SPRG_08114 [Saprolegnia parasitica CBS 223.65]